MIARVVINRHVARRNKKTGRNDPAISIQTSKGIKRSRVVEVRDEDGNIVGRFISRPDKPLKCGATVWFETDSGFLEVID